MKRFSLAMTWLAVAGLMTMVSCRKPVIGFSGDGRVVTISAVTENGNGSKTSIEDLNVNWSVGDQIKMNGSVLTLKEGAGTTEGIFEGTVTGEAPYYVGYPKEYISYVADPRSFSINIPASWPYDVAKQIVPMAAVTNSVEGGLQFHNAVNVLKMQLKGDGTEVSKLKSIVLTSATSNLSGKISVTFDGGTPEFAAIADGDGASKTMTVSFGTGLQLTDVAKCVYIPLAKIDGGDLTVRFNCANGKYMEKTIKVDSYATAFNGVNNVLDIETEVEVEGTTEPPYLPSEFSVGNDKKVKFSRGNLQWSAYGGGENQTTHSVLGGGEAAGTWRFAEHQYDIIGSNNGSISKIYNPEKPYKGWIDLFGWGTAGILKIEGRYFNPWETSASGSYYGPNGTDLSMGDNTDWGCNDISNDGELGAGAWRTLSKNEWDYLLNINGGENGRQGDRYARANVNGQTGLLIFPDEYSVKMPETGISEINSNTADYPTGNIDASVWESLESDGVVFLPAAGYRTYEGSNPVVYYKGQDTYGWYWSSTKSSGNSNAFYVKLNNNSFGIENTNKREGRSVRLVRDVE